MYLHIGQNEILPDHNGVDDAALYVVLLGAEN